MKETVKKIIFILGVLTVITSALILAYVLAKPQEDTVIDETIIATPSATLTPQAPKIITQPTTTQAPTNEIIIPLPKITLPLVNL